MEFIEYSLESLRNESVCLAEVVERDGYRPDCVAYLARGGWVIGETVASHFGVPVIELSAHRSGDDVKNRSASLLSVLPRGVRKCLREWEIRRRLKHDDGTAQHKTIHITERYSLPAQVERILLVDDSADTGASISTAAAKLSRAFPGAEIRVAVLNVFPQAKRGSSIDWHLHDGCLLCLPSSKDNREYPLFLTRYEAASSKDSSCEAIEGGPLISVVVAFYNVADCVDYCVSSLISQTYQNYELILVNDGSTDTTGTKLNSYAGHPKVRVVHKANGGLSDARNYGVSIAKGDYISFVDGDDLVSPRYLEVLAKGLEYGQNALIAALPVIIPFKSATTFSWSDAPDSDSYRLLSSRDALEKILYEEIKTSAWGKLAPRSLYETHRFPEGKYYEEIATVGSFVTSVDYVVQTDAEVYGYVMRPNSIVHRKQADMRQVKDYFEAISTITKCCEAEKVSLSALAFHKCLQLARIHTLLGVVEKNDEAHGAENRIATDIAECLPIVLQDGKVSLLKKMRFRLLAASPKLYDVLFAFFQRIKKGIR